MIVVQVELEPGFRRGDMDNIPPVRNETIFSFVSRVSQRSNNELIKRAQDVDLRVDFVQVRKVGDECEAKAVVFPAAAGGSSDAHVRVSIKVDQKRDQIVETICEQCSNKESCSHILAFLFWLHNKFVNTDVIPVRDFWGAETEAVIDEERSEALRVRDIFECDELRLEGDIAASSMSDIEGNAFADAVLNEMEALGLQESALFQHCRPSKDEFEPIFIHHTMLDAANNGVKDPRAFCQHMEEQAKQGLFERLTEVSRHSYKSHLWLETQYMRLRCSIIHRVVSRTNAVDDEQILQTLFCASRERNVEERQQLKQHKRFILKQTEKLENKTYQECGLLLNETYPFMCASPDGITDDHIVEIKAPKTEEEFEKYLEGRETIAPKYMAQIQIQMYMANVTKALYCVLSPTFDTNGALHYVWVQADMEFVASLLGAAEDFWRDIVFPRLTKTYFGS